MASLPSVKLCVNDHEMKLYFGKEYPFWQCNVHSCRKKVSIRVDTWFGHSRLAFTTIVRFIYFWAEELTSLKFCQKQLGMAGKTVIDWNSYMREVCVFSVENKNSGKIGGEGKIVEIDESLFTKRKNNAGRVLPQQWVFGGLCRETGQRFLVKVPNRGADTLLTEILNHIEPGSTILSDCWKGYKSEELENAGFTHFTVNHKYNFVDPDTGASTQYVERMWGSAKWRNKRQRGTARHHLDSYLVEYVWRSDVTASGGDAFNSILTNIAAFWVAQRQNQESD
ncbi:uncharacterized protein LOC120350347 [Nilaparvata lugens]|uniref:uncharacterized protein LOC120350347 n=1 Tax=Nilaparvata lugens TaxID=108931 RepID=UPI00193D2D04|nr:uncharacterized protein LOC120350347 [Nilaparvata lugens]